MFPELWHGFRVSSLTRLLAGVTLGKCNGIGIGVRTRCCTARGDATCMLCAYDENRRRVVFSSNPGQTIVSKGVGQERNGVVLT